ncbi:hypothetical protein ACFE04_010916 [Oxalis oulophora]
MERIIGETNGIIRKIRLEAPLHFVWKIESYSTLLESKWNKIESGSFEVDGHKWKLTFFPNGNNNHKGEGYVSLYLSISDTEEPPLSLDVSVIFKFLVFDQIKGKYLAIQDSNEMCRFQWMKTKWGFAQLLPLGVFKDPSNGFLIDDRCIFGVDIFVVNGSAKKGESFSVVKPLTSANSYSFKIQNFSTLKKVGGVQSDDFVIEGITWKLELLLKEDSKGKDNVSLYLLVVSKQPDLKVYVNYKLRIVDQVNGNHLEKTDENGNVTSDGWGYRQFAPLTTINDKSRGFLVKDTLIVEVVINYVSVVKRLS